MKKSFIKRGKNLDKAALRDIVNMIIDDLDFQDYFYSPVLRDSLKEKDIVEPITHIERENTGGKPETRVFFYLEGARENDIFLDFDIDIGVIYLKAISPLKIYIKKLRLGKIRAVKSIDFKNHVLSVVLR